MHHGGRDQWQTSAKGQHVVISFPCHVMSSITRQTDFTDSRPDCLVRPYYYYYYYYYYNVVGSMVVQQ